MSAEVSDDVPQRFATASDISSDEVPQRYATARDFGQDVDPSANFLETVGEEEESAKRPGFLGADAVSVGAIGAGGRYLDKDILLIKEGLGLMLMNQLKESEQLFADAHKDASLREVDPAMGEHDMRGCFSFVTGVMSMLKGLATLQNNQLGDALERLWEADALIALDWEWAGKNVLRGVCTVMAGVVLVMQGSLTKGVWHILRSWVWLRYLESEALVYSGPEKDIVRSTALFALGVFNLLVSLLPPYLLKTANWLSGFQGDRDVALSSLRICWEEDGIIAPFAAMALVGYHVDVRTFLGEPRSDSDDAECRRVLDWAGEKFPNSLFFNGLDANYWAVHRQVEKALDLTEEMKPVCVELPALGFVVHSRSAVYAQAVMDWNLAAKSFREALEVHKKVGRRSLVPAMAMSAALCHQILGAKAETEEMIALALQYKAMEDKTDWAMPDKKAFELAVDARAGTWTPELTLFQVMAVQYRSVCFMTDEKVDELLVLLHEVMQRSGEDDFDTQCRGLFIEAEVLRQVNRNEEALKACEAGLALRPKLSPDGRNSGCVQYLHFIAAFSLYHLGKLSLARQHLETLEALPKDHSLQRSVTFKSTQLARRVGLQVTDLYKEVCVGARSMLRLTADVSEATGRVDWDFIVSEYSINFRATFAPASDGLMPSDLQVAEDQKASDGPVMGGFTPTMKGTLTLTFDNTFSYMRSKTVLYKVEPVGLKFVEE